MTLTYENILNRTFDDLPEEKPLPNGDWLLRLRNGALIEAKSGNQNDKVLFFYQPIEPIMDGANPVDADELAALGDDYDYSENQIVVTFWIDGMRALKQVQRHLQKHTGVDFSMPIPDVIKKGASGAEVVAAVENRVYENNLGEMVTENTATNFRKPE